MYFSTYESLPWEQLRILEKKDVQEKVQIMYAWKARFYKKASTLNILLTSFLQSTQNKAFVIAMIFS